MALNCKTRANVPFHGSQQQGDSMLNGWLPPSRETSTPAAQVTRGCLGMKLPSLASQRLKPHLNSRGLGNVTCRWTQQNKKLRNYKASAGIHLLFKLMQVISFLSFGKWKEYRELTLKILPFRAFNFLLCLPRPPTTVPLLHLTIIRQFF